MASQLSSFHRRASYRHRHVTIWTRNPFAPVALITPSNINALSASSLIQVWLIFVPGAVVYPQVAGRLYRQENLALGICLARQSNGLVRRYWMPLLPLSFDGDYGRSNDWSNIWNKRLSVTCRTWFWRKRSHCIDYWMTFWSYLRMFCVLF